MKLPRRKFLQLAAGTTALHALSRIARAQTYPTRPVHVIVGYPAGNGSDIAARLMAQSLSERFGQKFIADNRPGASTNIATEVVVRSPSDGYTLLLTSSANAVNATLYPNLGFNFIRDIAPVASIARAPNVMVVNQSFPAKTVPEFIAYAKANPGKINMGSSGTGTGQHVAGELFKMMTRVDLVHVPYRGSYVPDLLAGQVQMAFAPVPQVIEYVRTGKLRALAVTSAMRSAALPGIPAVAEFVPGYEASVWLGVGAPKNASAEIIEKLNRGINAGLADPQVKARFADMGLEPMLMTPAEFGKFITEETEKYGKVVKFANIKPE
jgi:tripartite-type tricarboxylate transporter receptor subunit TctC